MDLMNLIGSFGFPMVACICIYLDTRKDKERMFDTIDTFGDKLDKFDITLNSISERLKDLERDGE